MRSAVLFLAVLTTVVMIFWAGLSLGWRTARSPQPARTPEKAESGLVRLGEEELEHAELKVEAVKLSTLPAPVGVVGSVETDPNRLVKVLPPVGGRVLWVRARPGDHVQSGQVLVRLASPELAQAQADFLSAGARQAASEVRWQRLQALAGMGELDRPDLESAQGRQLAASSNLEASRGALTAATVRLQQVKSRADLAHSRRLRADALLDAGVLARQDWELAHAEDDQAQQEVVSAEAALQADRQAETAARGQGKLSQRALGRQFGVYRQRLSSQGQLVEAEAAAKQARAERQAALRRVHLLGGVPGGGSELAVVAPQSGQVVSRNVTLGEIVRSDTVLFVLVDVSTVWARFDVYPLDSARVRVHQKLIAVPESDPERTLAGSVESVGDVVDPTTRTIQVRCRLPNQDHLLRPGAYLRGFFEGPGSSPQLVLPKAAVLSIQGAAGVFLALPQPGHFRFQPVEVGQELGDMVEIRQGLSQGDRVVTEHAFLLKSELLKASFGDSDD